MDQTQSQAFVQVPNMVRGGETFSIEAIPCIQPHIQSQLLKWKNKH